MEQVKKNQGKVISHVNQDFRVITEFFLARKNVRGKTLITYIYSIFIQLLTQELAKPSSPFRSAVQIEENKIKLLLKYVETVQFNF